MRVVLASWNVHGWVGRDTVRDPARSFEAIRALGADLVALQEAEGDDWHALARESDYHPVLGITRPIAFGNVLLTRVPLLRVERVDLSVPGREPRGALDAVARCCAHRELRVIATHLGLRAWERRWQAARLARHVERDVVPRPTVLMGDLNDWTWRAAQLKPLALCVGPFSRARTFPSQRPVLPLDRAAWRGVENTPRVEVVRLPLTRLASDHLPLRIELCVPERAAG